MDRSTIHIQRFHAKVSITDSLKTDEMGYIEDLRAIVGHRPLILVGSVVVIVDDKGRLLLQQRKFPHGVWGIPGGLMELEESAEDTYHKNTWELINRKRRRTIKPGSI